ncbi:hypothetical protein MPH_09727 [Macrophomina phaseolina MS6]|uniref:Zn(2)-C6 fungal-type domain-containing protein n=1 Tax=Macrophomina phaseolina (strain MS6) TaxID=1126212 RepID=K2RK18_MACPH|nr:hypothetical protein MPH_09727 [Macrophomina phaseolina MS6]
MSSVPPPEHRPAKRIRQACEPCRRKKSRCPGERPNCSHCSRLGQSCYYASDHPAASDHLYSSAAGSTHSADASRDPRGRHGSVSESADAVSTAPSGQPGPWADRLSVLETKVAEVLGALNRMPWTASPPTPSPSSALPTCVPAVEQHSPPVTASTLPPWDTIVSVAELYLAYCSSQPLPLFDPKTFISTLGTRDPEVLFGILATAIRFSDDPLYCDRQIQAIRGYAEAGRTLVMRRLANGPIELSTLQALCLLSLVDFSNGNTHRASSLSSLALDLAESAGLSIECHISSQDPSHEERRRCFWSILFLKKLHGANCGVYSISTDEIFPRFPSSTRQPPSPDLSLDARASQDGPRDEGIIAYVIQLSECWHRTLRYARRRTNPGMHYPWSAESEYSKIMVTMMEFECHMPYKHRFRPARFAERPTEDLEKQRNYWCPWLFSQMIYHTIMCLLNHPLILSLRLRNFRVSIPEIFLQHTADLIASHTDWVIHFMDILEEKSFRVTDPFIGHCVAVVATIYLQQSFADDAGIRTEKRTNFLKCLNFVRKLGTYWPHIAQIVRERERERRKNSSIPKISNQSAHH